MSILYPFQKLWLADQSRFKIGMMSRQIGKTFTSTLEIAEDVVAAELNKQRTRWVILSRGERQAKEAMDEGIKLHLRAMGVGFESLVGDFLLSDHTTIKALEVSTKHGSRITALPANPDTARGFSANVLLDEFAFHGDSRKIWAALFPVISKPGLKLRVVSTPNGKSNKFYEIMTGEDGAWSRHVVDIYRAVAEGLPRDIELLRKALGDADAWAQEYELKWLDEAQAWLSYDLITACEHELAGDPKGYQGGAVYLGIDIGRRKDLFVIAVLEEIGDVLWLRELVELKGASFFEQDQVLAEIFNKYMVVRCLMDQTGMGEKPVEDARRRYGSTRVEGILFTSSSKLNLATLGKQAFEDRKLRISMGSQDLRQDLHKLKKIMGPTGVPRFVAESDSQGHADRTWALFLGIAAAKQPRIIYGYEAATIKPNLRDRFEFDRDLDAGIRQGRFLQGAW